MKSKLCFAAKGISTDATTNEISAWGIWSGIESQGYPVFIHEVAFFSLQERDPSEPRVHEFIFRITLDDAVLLEKAGHIDFREGIWNRNTIRVHGLLVAQPGTLKFALNIGDSEFCSYVVKAQLMPTAEIAENEDNNGQQEAAD